MSRKTILEQNAPEQQSAVVVSSRGAAQQNTLRNIGLIIKHEYKKRLTQRSFIISTIVILVLIVIASFVPTIIGYFVTHSNSQTRITVVNNAGSIGGLNGDRLTSYIKMVLNGTSGTTGAANGDRAPNKDLRFTYYTTSSPTNDSNVSQVQALVSQLNILDKSSRLGLTPAKTSDLFAQPQFSDVNLNQAQNTRSTSDIIAGYILAYIGNILIYMAVLLYGSGVAMGVAEEKGSRIMEILVNAATPFQLLAGKIIGIGAAGLTQMALFVVIGIGALLLQLPLQAALLGSNSGLLNLSITGASITLLVLLLVYFILGFLLYATLFAAVGALVKRQDEVQNAVAPISMLLVAGYIVSFFGIYMPDAIWIKVISYVPFWTPTTMLVRIATGGVAPWEIAFTIVLMIVTEARSGATGQACTNEMSWAWLRHGDAVVGQHFVDLVL